MKATLTTLSPVHIGNGVTYNKGIDFIQQKGVVGIVDERKVLALIGNENIHHWISAIEKYEPERDFRKQPLLDLLQSRGITITDLTQICSRKGKLIDIDNNSSQLKEQYRSPLKGGCIPGSSLKGAIRTAMLDHRVDDDNFQFCVDDVKTEKQTGNSGQISIRWKSEKIEKEIFGPNPNKSIMRFIQIGDIYFPRETLTVYETEILNLEMGEWRFKKGKHFLVETIPAGQKAEFHFKIDTSLLEQNAINESGEWPDSLIHSLKDVSNFCELVTCTTESLIDWELSQFDNQPLPEAGEAMLYYYKRIKEHIQHLNQNEFIVRIGANSGWNFTTAAWIRKVSNVIPDFYMKELRKVIQRKYYSNLSLWPKTRKISREGHIFGFVKIALKK